MTIQLSVEMASLVSINTAYSILNFFTSSIKHAKILKMKENSTLSYFGNKLLK